MNAGAPTASRVPGGFWHRYAAWSLDFVAIAALAWFATRAQVHAGIDATRAGWRQLFGRASQAMSDALLSGRDLHSLAQALMQDPALRAAKDAARRQRKAEFKAQSIARASDLWPEFAASFAGHDGRAEAALIARWCLHKGGGA